jgi:hypothetical protein
MTWMNMAFGQKKNTNKNLIADEKSELKEIINVESLLLSTFLCIVVAFLKVQRHELRIVLWYPKTGLILNIFHIT